MLEQKFISGPQDNSPTLKLDEGSQIAVIGGGPAGSFFSHFLLDLADRFGIDVGVDIYEPKDFSKFGPIGCNHCGGIVSESLVQLLAAEGINIPSQVVRRGIEAYVLHTDVGSVRIDTPLHEKRIAAMYRGAGPLGIKDARWASFDGFLQELTKNSGAQLIHEWVKSIDFDETGRPVVTTRGGASRTYDLIVGAVGVNSALLKLIKTLEFGYDPPEITKTSIREFYMGQEMVQQYFGDAMHVFLLDIPRLKFAALIPKGNFVTLALLGEKIDKKLLQSFLESPEVKQCFPPDWDLSQNYQCQCFPYINVQSAVQPFADRVVLVGDCAASKLYKNGIGAAYATAKAAATTAIFQGISAEDFKQHYWPACQSINTDNSIGKIIFVITRQIQSRQSLKRGVLRVVAKESHKEGNRRHMSSVLWDTFTGSAPYKDIFLRTLRPGFFAPFIWETMAGILPFSKDGKEEKEQMMTTDALGKVYQDGENIINQGEAGDCMYVIQSGKVVIVQDRAGKKVHLAELGEGDFFGEMALFEREVRSTSVRAQGKVRVLTVDKRTLLRRIQEDPSMAFRILQKMSSRIRELDAQLSHIKTADSGD
jgi:flavin-dependent dehydrogenase